MPLFHTFRSLATLLILVVTCSFGDAQAVPPKPDQVSARCSISSCMVRWADPSSVYVGHKHTVVYRNKADDSQFAVQVGKSTHTGYYDENLE